MMKLSRQEKVKAYITMIVGHIFIIMPFVFLLVNLKNHNFSIESYEIHIQEKIFLIISIALATGSILLPKHLSKLSNYVYIKTFKNMTENEKIISSWHLQVVLRQVMAESISMFGFITVRTNQSFNLSSLILFGISIILLIKGRPTFNELNKKINDSKKVQQQGYRIKLNKN